MRMANPAEKGNYWEHLHNQKAAESGPCIAGGGEDPPTKSYEQELQ